MNNFEYCEGKGIWGAKCKNTAKKYSKFCKKHRCTIDKCNNGAFYIHTYSNQDDFYNYSNYCIQHKCYEKDCLNIKENESNYCHDHKCQLCNNRIEYYYLCCDHLRCNYNECFNNRCLSAHKSDFCKKHCSICSSIHYSKEK